jgi:xanthine/uracil permease
VQLPVATLRTGLGIVLIGGGLGLLTKAGADIPAPVLGGAPVVLLLLFVGQGIRRRARTERAMPDAAPSPLAQPVVD